MRRYPPETASGSRPHDSQASDLLNPCVHNRNVDGVDGFATSDVLEEHPSKKGFFRIIGRADDQIMHSTGEKVRWTLLSCYDFVHDVASHHGQTNPGPLGGQLAS